MDAIESGQLALLDVFARVCKSINNEDAQRVVNEATHAREDSLSRYLDDLKNKASLVDELTAKNETLQIELAAAIKELEDKRKEDVAREMAAALRPLRTPTPLSTLATSDVSRKSDRGASPMLEDVDNLNLADPVVAAYMKAKYRKVKNQRDDVASAKDRAIQAWRREKETRLQWQGLAENLQKRLDKSSDNSTQAIGFTRAVELRSDDEITTMPSSPPLNAVPELPAHLPDLALDNGGNAVDIVRASDTTESGSDRPVEDPTSDSVAAEVPVPIKEESQDLPVVVSSRVIKKRQPPRMQSDFENHLTTKIKTEILSSSPVIGVARLNKLMPHESMDLDDAGPPTVTPKKSRFIDPRLHSIATLQRSRTTDEDVTPTKGLDYPTAMREIDRMQAKQNTPLARSGQPRIPLQPRDPNRDHLPRTTTAPATSRKRRRVEDIAADGEDSESPFLKKNNQRNTKAIDMSDEVRDRLNSLLQPLSPPKTAFKMPRPLDETTPISPSVNRVLTTDNGEHDNYSDKDAHAKTTTRPRAPPQPSNAPTRTTRSTTKAESSTFHPTTPLNADSHDHAAIEAEAADPSHEPFRARPLSRLSLEHFKPNLAYNQNQPHPFTSTIRGRTARKCLEGCTNPACCGSKFREWVAFTTPTTPTASQAERDQTLLEEYLGANAHRLADMSAEERKETLLQAKTRQMAKEHGKHRALYERRRTPPGFWDPDFPETQEQEVIRQEARAREREIVEERWRDAMREGGRWVFRDE